MGPGPARARRLRTCVPSRSTSSKTGFDGRELDTLLRDPTAEEKADQAPPLPEVAVTLPGDLWLLGPHRVLCADATSPEAVARLLGERKPFLMVTDPPYGIELDSEWRDRAGLNGCGPAEASYMKHRTEGHTKPRSRRYTSRLVGSLRAGAQPADRLRLARIRSSRARSSTACCGSASCTTSRSSGTRAGPFSPDALLVPARALLVRPEEERAVVREGRRELDDLGFAVARSSSWAAPRRRSSIIRRRSRSN